MKLNELKLLLSNNPDKQFRLKLPNDAHVPESFHITEVGMVTKTFIDCGGRTHTRKTCQLQAWIGTDTDHRIEAGKMAHILELSRSLVPDDSLDIEVEYEDAVISQYPVQEAVVAGDSVTLILGLKHTDCLAKDRCLPVVGSGEECCGGTGCC